MHVGGLEKGMEPAVAIVAGGVPVATGIALAFKFRKEPRVFSLSTRRLPPQPNLPSRPAPSTSPASPQWVSRTDTLEC